MRLLFEAKVARFGKRSFHKSELRGNLVCSVEGNHCGKLCEGEELFKVEAERLFWRQASIRRRLE